MRYFHPAVGTAQDHGKRTVVHIKNIRLKHLPAASDESRDA
jgi:hypothetical protein